MITFYSRPAQICGVRTILLNGAHSHIYTTLFQKWGLPCFYQAVDYCSWKEENIMLQPCFLLNCAKL